MGETDGGGCAGGDLVRGRAGRGEAGPARGRLLHHRGRVGGEEETTENLNHLLPLQERLCDSVQERGGGQSGGWSPRTFRLLRGDRPHAGQTQGRHCDSGGTSQVCQAGPGEV